MRCGDAVFEELKSGGAGSEVKWWRCEASDDYVTLQKSHDSFVCSVAKASLLLHEGLFLRYLFMSDI